MTNGMQDPLMLSMSRKEAKKFLNDLENDDAFRRRLRNNPQKALAEVGIVLSKGSIPDEVELPEKGEIAKFLKPEVEKVPWAGCLIWGLVNLAATGMKPPSKRRRRTPRS